MGESNAEKRELFVTTSFPDVSIEHNPELPWMVLRAKTADGGQVIEVKLPREDPK
ncbi:hypothetical protein [Calidifontibacter terrae]